MRFAITILLGLASSGCLDDNPPLVPPVDEAFYRCEVQPVLDQSCSAVACHGTVDRPFHIYSRNRLRLNATTGADLILPLTDEELALNFENARAYVQDDAGQSWILRKPLAQASGGWFHIGEYLFDGGDVWRTPDDPGFQTVLAWVLGETEDPDCVYVGSK